MCLKTQPICGLFNALSDELMMYLMYFFDARALIHIEQLNRVFAIFAREEPLWKFLALQNISLKNLMYQSSWRSSVLVFTSNNQFRPMSLVQENNYPSMFLYQRWYRCHLHLSSFTQILPQHALPQFSQQQLLENNLFKRCFTKFPIQITQAIDTWTALSAWNFENFAQRFDSSKTFSITHNIDISNDKLLKETDRRMSFRAYFRYMQQQHDECPLYIFDAHFDKVVPELLDEYDVGDLKLFDQDFLAAHHPRPDFRWLVIGPERSGAPWHIDPSHTSAWNALLVGRKRWALYPPDQIPPGVVYDDEEHDKMDQSGLTSLQWYLQIYPTLSEENRPFEIIQERGQVISVPAGWWHLVLNLEPTIAVTQNYVSDANLDLFCQDLVDSDPSLRQFEYFRSKFLSDNSRLSFLYRPHFELFEFPLQYYNCLSAEEFIEEFHQVNGFWVDFISGLCKRHHLNSPKTSECWLCHHPENEIQLISSGRNPTFKVSGDYVFKFFTFYPEFRIADALTANRMKQYETEKQVYLRVIYCSQVLKNYCPELIGYGFFHQRNQMRTRMPWPWPYLILSNLQSQLSIKEFRQTTHQPLSMASATHLINWLSDIILPELNNSILNFTTATEPQWDSYQKFLFKRRDMCIGELGTKLGNRRLFNDLINIFLHPNWENFILPTHLKYPVLLHGDLNDENLMGIVEDDQGMDWKVKYLIDFGDALIGDPLYELVAIFLSVFHANRTFLAGFLQTNYSKQVFQTCNACGGIPYQIARRFLYLIILHPSVALQVCFQEFPETQQVNSWKEVQDIIFQTITCSCCDYV